MIYSKVIKRSFTAFIPHIWWDKRNKSALKSKLYAMLKKPTHK
ncbi:hypothetical protein SAMN04487988_1172 [Algoriphagus hitonicola]|uniref:Uncharacterized protein n=1 Tax=Algoriphagus hitonicola TaxID=435880 RepID=A0A1I2XC91_9BACT|nr:hypothetical protein SAMN04487988_1172 [Algoriphagus hitonicola]